mmetsp:Transcript_429/g.784  ORF Transcript_429/g.784 Transcript_429/m.784 type:complete len:946 (+) Transcript_429:33-2870(+)
MVLLEEPCNAIVFYNKQAPSKKEIVDKLENGKDEEKYEALKHVILLQMNGESQSHLIMTIIKYVLTTEYKPLKKLLLFFWEAVEKRTPKGELLPIMTLVCSHLINDLSHANEYVVGCTLRFLCKISNKELLQPLVAPVVSNLGHRQSYVRRQAILTVYSIYYIHGHTSLIPDAPEMVQEFIEKETDIASKRNAFIMLQDVAPNKAAKFIRSILSDIHKTGHLFQLELLRLLKKMCAIYPNEKSKYLRLIAQLMNSKSSSVLFQCAMAFTELSTSSIAISTAASCFVKLLINESDMNVKMVVIDRIQQLAERFPYIMQSRIQELLRGLTVSDVEIKYKLLDVIMKLITNNNVGKVIAHLKREFTDSLAKPVDSEFEQVYRSIIIESIHEASMKFPDLISGEIVSLIRFINDASAAPLARFIREIVGTVESIREAVIDEIVENITNINDPAVFSIIFWILGDFATTKDQITRSIEAIQTEIADIELKVNVPAKEDDDILSVGSETSSKYSAAPSSTAPLLNPDGTYASYSSYKKNETTNTTSSVRQFELIHLFKKGFSYLMNIVSSTLTKLILRLRSIDDIESDFLNKTTAKVMMSLCAMIRTAGEDDTDVDRHLKLCLFVLSKKDPRYRTIFLERSHKAYETILNDRINEIKESSIEHTKERENARVEVHELINFVQLTQEVHDMYQEEEIAVDIKPTQENEFEHVVQLTGVSDEVYAEAVVHVNELDVTFDILLVNQTGRTIQNVTLDLATMGDLHLCDRPSSCTIAPNGRVNLKTSVKVASSETSMLFGNIVFDYSQGGLESTCIILNSINLDIMDYIKPSTLPPHRFRNYWMAFLMENKVAIKISNPSFSLIQVLRYVAHLTHMNILTPESTLEGDCAYLSANLSSRSTFGEDAVANASLEKLENGMIEGTFRIRSKNKGIARALGKTILHNQNNIASYYENH